MILALGTAAASPQQGKGYSQVPDRRRNILKAFEYYQDIRLPGNLIGDIHREYPGWIPDNSRYIVSYGSNKEVKKVYKLWLAKDDSRKKLKLSL
ncbi:hypothetical protein [Arenibacter nanhaiticus]|uniref:hypothetical protein n=1 Tax=Arenibacter nanhaiticus TaxID=558155 RepID=UPI0009348594|nr:hypothetical protein [Arenibacter nanhaiticus]